MIELKMQNNVISIKGVSKSYGEVKALNGIDLSVNRGEMCCIVGPDGAGKTTLMRILCGIIPADSGEIQALGLKIPADIKSIRNQIGYLSQKFSLYGDLTIDENIEFFAEIHKVKDFKARRDELLEFTRLKPFRKRMSERLSGGMKQKLALACTLIHKPEIIYLDEPTTGVDPVSRRDFWKILSDLLRQGITIVMNTPYMDEAERGNQVVMLHQGVIINKGTPQDIKSRLTGTIMEIVTDNIRRDARILKEISPAFDVQTFGDRMNVLCDDGDFLNKEIEKAGIKPLNIRQIQPSLENVFISTLKKI